jgi:hypothetical protein
MISMSAIKSNLPVWLQIVGITVASIAGLLIPLIRGFYRKYLRGPKLELKLTSVETANKTVDHILRKENDTFRNIDTREVTAKYKFTLINNSELVAYSVQLDIKKSPLHLELDEYNIFGSIDRTTQKVINGTTVYKYVKDGVSQNTTDRGLEGLEILLSYENEKGSRFYTEYRIDDKEVNEQYSHTYKLLHRR